ncbi:MAG: WhiB family transcriptional regulator [Acidimicrobiia bacterium]|jgi:WhiB family redox-sensing transcriptional regulator|nr:WhiB family transcriptional regulator [Gemmatimonadota bacterium]MDH5372644.1 WhiB family transcriptional regulator [Acidimicrobiia bacterium]
MTQLTAVSSGWVTYAACRDEDLSLFFPEDASKEQADQAIAVCHLCPIMWQCRSHARTAREPAGIWGGERQEERARAIRHSSGRRNLTCAECDEPFEAPNGRRKVCGQVCRIKRRRRQVVASNKRRGQAA